MNTVGFFQKKSVKWTVTCHCFVRPVVYLYSKTKYVVSRPKQTANVVEKKSVFVDSRLVVLFDEYDN